MYRQSRFVELLQDLSLEFPQLNVDQNQFTQFSLTTQFTPDALSIVLSEEHDEFPDYAGCGCCGCGDAAIKGMLGTDTSTLSAETGTTTTLFMDTIAGDSSTTATLAIGGTATGTRETGTDADWFQVELVSGTEYTFFMLRDGTTNEHGDPLMKLIGTDGTTVLVENDDITSGQQNSKITYTATETGTFYISAEGWTTTTGDYKLFANVGSSRPTATLDDFADWLTDGFSTGAKWGKSTITYNVSAIEAGAQNLATLAFEAWGEVSGLTFVRTTGAADITFQQSGTDANGDPETGAFASTSRSGSTITSSRIHIDADWDANADGSNNYALNSYHYQTYLHEIGHALGLGHGGPYNGNSTYGTDNIFANDAWNYTVMSYHSQTEAGSGTGRLVLGLEIVDIIAIQNLYGAATTTRGGDTVYGFNSTETDVFNFETTFFNNGIRPPSISISDTDGIDTLDFSGYSANQTINLVQETFSSIGDNTNTADVTDALVNNISIARNTVIENAIGGSGNDTITGNSASNIITGGTGNDILDGGTGVDYVNYVSGTLGDYTITDNGNGTLTIASAAFGTDTVSNFEFIRVNGVDQALPGTVPAAPTENDDTLNGTSGDDTINALGGNDTVNGLGGNDTIDGGAGNDVLDGGAGIDRAVYTSATSRVVVNLGTLGAQDTQGSGTDTLSNFEQVEGSAFNDILYGNSSANYVVGGDGNDYIDGGAGGDVLDGGAGNSDWVTYQSETAGVTIDLSLAGAQTTNDILSGFENLEGSNFGDALTGDSGNNYVDGKSGDDTINATLGTDILVGGAGTDVLSYAGATGAVSVSLAITTAQATGGSGTHTISGFENLTGSNQADTLTGDSGSNVLEGGLGNDALDGGDGVDYAGYASGVLADYSITYNMDGSVTVTHATFGTDTLTNMEFLTINGVNHELSGPGFGATEGNDTIQGTAGDDTVDALGGNDVVNGLTGNDTLSGGSGNDVIDGGAGNDTLDGGTGADMVSYESATARVIVDLNLTTAQDTQGAGIDTLSGFEQVLGTSFRDILYGTSGSNYVLGGDGNDYIDGGAGGDVLDGGAGTQDWVTYQSETSGVTVDLSNTGVQATNDIISGFENLEGSNFGDVLRGDSGNNYVDGKAGNDLIRASLGTDILDGGTGEDYVSYMTSSAGVTVSLAIVGAQNTIGSGTHTLMNVENLFGSTLADTLTGDSGNNIINGQMGNDIIDGGDGNDTLVGGGGFDTLSYQSATAGVTVNLALIVAQDTGGAGIDTVSGFDYLIGSDHNDTLTGSDGADIIDGGAGNDVIDGGLGSDRVTYETATSRVVIDLANGNAQDTGGSGIDTLTNVEQVVGTAFRDILYGTSGGNYLIGGEGNDYIDGGDGGDVLDGGVGTSDWVSYLRSSSGVTVDLSNAGVQATNDIISGFENLEGSHFNDTLTGDAGFNYVDGQAGDDVVNGGAGNDFLIGGSGADQFLFEAGFGVDTVTDFADGTDLLRFDIAGLTQFSQLTVVQDGADTLVSYDGQSVRLVGVTSTDITGADTAFGAIAAQEKVDVTDLVAEPYPTDSFVFKGADELVPIAEVMDDASVFDVSDAHITQFQAQLEAYSYEMHEGQPMTYLNEFGVLSLITPDDDGYWDMVG